MKGKRDTGIPEFHSLEEEKEYWEARGPLAEGHKGRINKPKQKRSSFLAVRLTGDELTRLRDVAASKGLGPSTFARLLLTSVITRDSKLPKNVTLDELKDILEKHLPQSLRVRAENLLKDASIGDPDNPAFSFFDRSQMGELGELGLKAVSILLAMYGVQVITEDHDKYEEIKTLVHSNK